MTIYMQTVEISKREMCSVYSEAIVETRMLWLFHAKSVEILHETILHIHIII